MQSVWRMRKARKTEAGAIAVGSMPMRPPGGGGGDGGPAQSPGTFDLFDLVADAEVARQEGDPAQADTKADLASGLSNQLRTLRGRLLVFLQRLEERGDKLEMARRPAVAGRAAEEHPTVATTVLFYKFLAMQRVYAFRASLWNEAAWRDPAVVRSGMARTTLEVQHRNIHTHLWPELWPAMPSLGSEEARRYWYDVHKQGLAMLSGQGGGMRAAATAAGDAARTHAQRRGLGLAEQEAAAAGLAHRVTASLRAATAQVSTREHLGLVGERQLNDVMLTDPFYCNLRMLLDAVVALHRQTCARPGMVVNCVGDDASEHWRNTPPLLVGDLHIHADAYVEATTKVV